MSCLSDIQVLDFAHGTGTPADRALVEAHLTSCRNCLFLVSQAAGYFAEQAAPGAGTPPDDPDDPILPPLDVPVALTRYVVEECIGAGAAGTVYRAFDPQLRRRVALKVLRPRSLPGISTHQAQARLLGEAHAMAQLSHPNVVPVFDAGSLAEHIFIVMELVDGQNLSSWLAGGRRTWHQIVAVFVGAGEGLAAAHAAHLVHRDFKPDNVLIGADGRPRVTDFGLARSMTGDAPAPDAGPSTTGGDRLSAELKTGVAGTPVYMAPEQFQGKTADARTDQFSFCVALFMALTGYHPFAGPERKDLSVGELARHASAGKAILPPAEKGLPEWLTAALLRGLSIDPSGRWPAMGDLLTALRGPKRKRRPWLAVAASAGAVALVAASWVVAAGPRCGNGTAEKGEECDDGNPSGADACLPTCRWARCGDGQVRPGVETCDDGNTRDGDGCTSKCLACSGPGRFGWDGNGHCYSKYEAPLPWHQALARCTAEGASLVAYGGSKEGATVAMGLDTAGPADVWIGLHRRTSRDRPETLAVAHQDELVFRWVTGQPPLYLWWAEGQPAADKHCVHQAKAQPARNAERFTGIAAWFAARCEEPRPFVCEQSAWAIRPATNHAFYLVTQPMTWSEAGDACRRLSPRGHLATIADAEELAFVSALSPQTVWLGAGDHRREGTFSWVIGEPFEFQAFAPGEPDDDHSSDCAVLAPDSLWFDRPCLDRYPAICEVD